MRDAKALIRAAWETGRTIDLTGIGYGRIHWDDQRTVVSDPYAYYYFLAGLVRVSGARRILEIGTHSGGSVRAMQAGLSSSDGAVLVTVDMTRESDPYLTGGSPVRKIVGDANSSETFCSVCRQFDQGCDLIFIDAVSDPWPTYQTYSLYVAALRPTLVVLDDITLNPGMEQFWAFVQGTVPDGNAIDASQFEPAIRPAGALRPGFGIVLQSRDVDEAARPDTRPATGGPVFVLGAPRSGTSIMQRALKEAGGYVGRDEGHFLPVLSEIARGIENHYQRHRELEAYDFLVNRISADDVIAECAAAVRGLVDRHYEGRHWSDKTHGRLMIDAVPELAQAFPDASFVYLQRRGLEVVRSALIKRAGSGFSELCEQWAEIDERWREVRAAIEGRSLVVEHRELLEDPMGVAGRLGRLLGLSGIQQGELARMFRTHFPEKTPGFSYAPVSIEDIGWAPGEMETFKQICGPAMARLGYSYGHAYYAHGGRVSDSLHQRPAQMAPSHGEELRRWVEAVPSFYREYQRPVSVQSMTVPSELGFVESYAREQFTGAGKIVDLGCWMGGTTYSLARGLAQNERARTNRRIEAFDLFRWEPWMKEAGVREDAPGALQSIQPNDSFRELVEQLLRPFASTVSLFEADLTNYAPPVEPIEFLFIDAMKSWPLAQAILSGFFPRLLPGISVVVQQDYGWHEARQATNHLAMWMLRDSFAPLHHVEHGGSVAFLCTAPIPHERVASFTPGSFSPADINAAYADSVRWVHGPQQQGVRASHLAFLLEQGLENMALEVGHVMLDSGHRLYPGAVESVRESIATRRVECGGSAAGNLRLSEMEQLLVQLRGV